MSFCKHSAFNPEQDIPPLDGKVILVTGGNIGLGKQCILEYARHNPAQIWLAARNLDKAKVAVDEIQSQLSRPAPIRLLELDLSSLESVKKAASAFASEADRLDILMLNAGIMATPPGLTNDGYELQFGTNYVGHALLAKLLLPVLEKTASRPDADVRVIMLTSYGHHYTPKGGIRFDTLKTNGDTLGAYERYGQSKLAMILWARQMAKLYPQFTVASVHPGVVQTNLANGATATDTPRGMGVLLKLASLVIAVPVTQGTWNQLWASVSKNVKSGEYYEPVGKSGRATEYGKSDELATNLWGWTEKELQGFAT